MILSLLIPSKSWLHHLKFVGKFKYFTVLKKNYPEHLGNLCQKAYYPYDWVNDIKQLERKGRTPKASVYASLKQEAINDEEDKHAQKVYKQLKCKSCKGDHMT